MTEDGGHGSVELDGAGFPTAAGADTFIISFAFPSLADVETAAVAHADVSTAQPDSQVAVTTTT